MTQKRRPRSAAPETQLPLAGSPMPPPAPAAPAVAPPPGKPAPEPAPAATAPAPLGADRRIEIEVEPRKPRLAWQGMERREIAVEVPAQVVEIVRPGRAVERDDPLLHTDVRRVEARDASALPPNRLIWTNDNVVALQTLLDERDPATGDYRYRGKVDLVYIDPPFMVQSDFRADNAIDIEIDEDEHVQAKKEPSLVEILAYKDTWRQGLDSFLTMLRARLLLLKDLLASTGSIYVHLDWHAVHYVKVLMDEIFGYENFINEVVWKRTNARSTSGMWPRIHDTLLVYGMTVDRFLEPETADGDANKLPHTLITGSDGKKYQTFELTAPGVRTGETGRPWRGFDPTPMGRHWANLHAVMDGWDSRGLIHWPAKSGFPRRRAAEPFVPESRQTTISDVWTDIDRLNQAAHDRFGFPTQKPAALLERIVRSSCSPGGLVLDCFMGSGTTIEAAERLGRRWIGIDNGKYAIHLARKRLIQLHGQMRPPEKPIYDYVECKHCKNIERKEKPQRSPGPFQVRPFTVENMGVYQRAELWQGFQTRHTHYRDEMIKVFGGEPMSGHGLLHGKKGGAWIHVGPLDAPIAVGQVWSIARAAAATDTRAVTILSADYSTLAASDKEELHASLGVAVTIRVIPAQAIDEVRRRIEIQRKGSDLPLESMAVPAFYAPLSIVLGHAVEGRKVTITLERCEIDIESFIASQQPILKPITEAMSAAARKKAQAELEKWDERRKNLDRWLAKADTWKKFVDFWAVDWDYGRRQGTDDKPIFETDWQSFRTRKSKGEVEELVLAAELVYPHAGRYRVAARVTDVFGNDGIAAVNVDVK